MKISKELRSRCFEVCVRVGEWITPVLNDPHVQENYMGSQVKIVGHYLDNCKVTDVNLRRFFLAMIEQAAQSNPVKQTTNTLSPLNLYVNICAATMIMFYESFEEVDIKEEISSLLNENDFQGFIQYILDVAAYVSQKMIGGNLLKPNLQVKDLDFLMGK